MTLSKNLIPSDDAQVVRATGKGVLEIDLLPPKVVKNCRFLYVSYNSISNLDNIVQFRFMQSLMIEYNLIETIETLLPLAKLPNLRTIRLEGNPICFLPLWELHLIRICPQIVYINGVAVKSILKSKESRYKIDYIDIERNFIQIIYLADYVYKSIEIVLKHPEIEFQESNNLVELPNENEYSQEIRCRFKNAKPGQYMSELKALILEKHQEVQDLANTCSKIPNLSIRKHRKTLSNASHAKGIVQFSELVEPLSSACLFMVGIGDGVQLNPDDCQSVASRMSRASTASTASKSSRARSVLKGVKKVNDSQKKKSRNNSVAGDEDFDQFNNENFDNENQNDEISLNDQQNQDDDMNNAEKMQNENENENNTNENFDDENANENYHDNKNANDFQIEEDPLKSSDLDEENENKMNDNDDDTNKSKKNNKNENQNFGEDDFNENDNKMSGKDKEYDPSNTKKGNKRDNLNFESNDDEPDDYDQNHDYDENENKISGKGQEYDPSNIKKGNRRGNQDLDSDDLNGNNDIDDIYDQNQDYDENAIKNSKFDPDFQNDINKEGQNKNDYNFAEEEEFSNDFDNDDLHNKTGKANKGQDNSSNGQNHDEKGFNENSGKGKLANGQKKGDKYNDDKNFDEEDIIDGQYPIKKGLNGKPGKNVLVDDPKKGNKRNGGKFDEENTIDNQYPKKKGLNTKPGKDILVDDPKKGDKYNDSKNLDDDEAIIDGQYPKKNENKPNDGKFNEKDMIDDQYPKKKGLNTKSGKGKLVNEQKKGDKHINGKFEEEDIIDDQYPKKKGLNTKPGKNITVDDSKKGNKHNDGRLDEEDIHDDEQNPMKDGFNDKADFEEKDSVNASRPTKKGLNDQANDLINKLNSAKKAVNDDEEEDGQNQDDLEKEINDIDTKIKLSKFKIDGKTSEEEDPFDEEEIDRLLNEEESYGDINRLTEKYKYLLNGNEYDSEEEELDENKLNVDLNAKDDKADAFGQNHDYDENAVKNSKFDPDFNNKYNNKEGKNKNDDNFAAEEESFNDFDNDDLHNKTGKAKKGRVNFANAQNPDKKGKLVDVPKKGDKYNDNKNFDDDQEVIIDDQYPKKKGLNTKPGKDILVDDPKKGDKLNDGKFDEAGIIDGQHPKKKGLNTKPGKGKLVNDPNNGDKYNDNKNFDEEDIINGQYPKKKGLNAQPGKNNLVYDPNNIKKGNKRGNQNLDSDDLNGNVDKADVYDQNHDYDENENKMSCKGHGYDPNNINSVKNSKFNPDHQNYTNKEGKNKNDYNSEEEEEFSNDFDNDDLHNKIGKANKDKDNLSNEHNLDEKGFNENSGKFLSPQISEFKNDINDSPQESDILHNSKIEVNTSDVIFDKIEEEEKNEIEDVQINIIDSITPLNSDVLKNIEYLDPQPNNIDSNDDDQNLSIVQLAHQMQQKKVTESEPLSSSSFVENKDEFASAENLMNSAARFGEPPSKDLKRTPRFDKPIPLKKSNASSKSDKPSGKPGKNSQDPNAELSDIRGVTDGDAFDASIGTSDNFRKKPKSSKSSSSRSGNLPNSSKTNDLASSPKSGKVVEFNPDLNYENSEENYVSNGDDFVASIGTSDNFRKKPKSGKSSSSRSGNLPGSTKQDDLAKSGKNVGFGQDPNAENSEENYSDIRDAIDGNAFDASIGTSDNFRKKPKSSKSSSSRSGNLPGSTKQNGLSNSANPYDKSQNSNKYGNLAKSGKNSQDPNAENSEENYSDIRDATDGNTFDASLGTSDHYRKKPKPGKSSSTKSDNLPNSSKTNDMASSPKSGKVVEFNPDLNYENSEENYVSDGDDFVASIGTSDNFRHRPKSILKNSSAKDSTKPEKSKRITFAPPSDFATMSGVSSSVEAVFILRPAVPNYTLLDKFFSLWKRKFKVRIEKTRLVKSTRQTTKVDIEEIRYRTVSVMRDRTNEQYDAIKQLAIKHELIRQIEIQRDINDKLRERYEQSQREAAARRSTKPIPQSPLFNRSSTASRRVVDEDILNFTRQSRAAVQQSTLVSTTVPKNVTTTGRITHMDILRLQMGY